MSDASWVVLKFGGTSVSSLENWRIICQVLAERLRENKRVCVVHSALSGISNLLESTLNAAVANQYHEGVKAIKEQHLVLAEAMDLDGNELLKADFEQLDHVLHGVFLVGEFSARTQARLAALGELMATRLSFAFMRKQDDLSDQVQWLDARELLLAEEKEELENANHFLNATCDYQLDKPLLAKSQSWRNIVVTQGFIAADVRGQTVLLGRGGSDTSGAYLAAKLGAQRYEIWTDVPGMFTANPREISTARLIKQLAYDEAQEIATTGAKILHPRCILPVRQHQIPTQIFCTSRPDLEGTKISETAGNNAQVKALSIRKQVTLLSLETVGMWRQVGFLADAFTHFKDLGVSIDLVSTSESNVTVSLDNSNNNLAVDTLARLKKRLEPICQVTILEDCAAVSVVGRSIRTILHKIGPAFEVFHEHKIHLLSQAANDLNLTIVVDESQADRLVQQLHSMFIDKTRDSINFGDTWETIFKVQEQTKTVEPAWWRRNARKLLTLTENDNPSYVYNLATVDEKINQLQALDSLDQIFYAMKANSHPEVLRRVYDKGLGFECVSTGELALIFSLFPNIDGERVMFTSNFAARDEYEHAFSKGCYVTLDNTYPLYNWLDSFANKSIVLRIDPGQGRGHHEHVKTAGSQSKFGIPMDEVADVISATASVNCKVVGLHAHTGSGILTPHNWQDTAVHLSRLAEQFPHVKFLDLGGGLGVPEKQGQVALDLVAVNDSLKEIKKAFPNYQLWLEPGRFIVAQSGVLLAEVTQLKGKGEYRYLGINTGMNSLIRPALYGAYHDIVNLTKINEVASEYYDVVGPICETGDKLGMERLLPPTEEKDMILIANTGAYGYVMSSNYNQREPAKEVIVDW